MNGPLQGVATSQRKSLRSLSIFYSDEDMEDLARLKAAFPMEWTKRDDQHRDCTERRQLAERPTKRLPRRADRRCQPDQAINAIAGSSARLQFYSVTVSIDNKRDLPLRYTLIQDVL